MYLFEVIVFVSSDSHILWFVKHVVRLSKNIVYITVGPEAYFQYI